MPNLSEYPKGGSFHAAGIAGPCPTRSVPVHDCGSSSVLGAVRQPAAPTFASLQLHPKWQDPSTLWSSVPWDQHIAEERAGNTVSALPGSTASSVDDDGELQMLLCLGCRSSPGDIYQSATSCLSIAVPLRLSS